MRALGAVLAVCVIGCANEKKATDPVWCFTGSDERAGMGACAHFPCDGCEEARDYACVDGSDIMRGSAIERCFRLYSQCLRFVDLVKDDRDFGIGVCRVIHAGN